MGRYTFQEKNQLNLLELEEQYQLALLDLKSKESVFEQVSSEYVDVAIYEVEAAKRRVVSLMKEIDVAKKAVPKLPEKNKIKTLWLNFIKLRHT